MNSNQSQHKMPTILSGFHALRCICCLVGLSSLISDITPNLFIGFFVDSIKNFIVAIAWPVYWMSDIHSDYIWIWFVVAYMSYWGGSRYALHQAGRSNS